jgi:hypothetical protein
MKATILYGRGDVRLEDRPEPTIILPTDAIVRLSATCICACSAISQLFELDRLVFSVFVDRRSPDLVRSLVFGAAKTELGSKTQVEIARILQDVDELLGIELRSGTPKPLD